MAESEPASEAAAEPIPAPIRYRRLRNVGRILLVALLVLLVTAMTAWGAAFLWFSNLPWAPLRATMAIVFAAGTLGSFLFLKRRSLTLTAYLAVFVLLLIWFFSLRPSNDRVWAPEVAVLATATVNGHFVEIKNVRNFDYRTETDFTPRYYDKTYDLDKLQSVDLVLSTWGIPGVAHVLVSFGFSDDQYVCFTIEMRPEKDEVRSMVQSFFRKYELIYLVSDERDVIRLRTNYRQPHEQVHIYRTRLPVEHQRDLFLSYVSKVDQLSRKPEWYNALQDNCTTGVLDRTKTYKGRARYNWKILAAGYVAEYAYDIGMLDRRIPFSELTQRAAVNAKAEAADQAPDFSRRIREGVPLPEPMTMQEFHLEQ
jgi:hypothetical protein